VVRRFEVVRSGEVVATGVEFETEQGRPAVVCDTLAGVPGVYAAVGHVTMAWPNTTLRWLDEPVPAASTGQAPAGRVEGGDASAGRPDPRYTGTSFEDMRASAAAHGQPWALDGYQYGAPGSHEDEVRRAREG
jgi:hypothetical protein